MKESHDNIFNSNLTYQEQIEFVIKAIHSPDRTKKTGQTAIGRLFNVSKGAIHSHLTRMNSERRSVVGRPPLLNEEEQQMIIDYIFQCYDENNPPNLFSLIDIIFNKFNVLYSYNTLYKQIQESKQIKTVLAPVYDSTRADVQLDDIKQYYIDLNHIFQQTNVPPSFIINVDESGFVDFVDERNEIVIVPIEAPEGTVKSVNRSSKRSTMIGAISLDGTRLKPCVILTGKRSEKQIIIDGYGDENVLVIHQENGFVNSESFAYWADTILFPSILERRKATGYQDEAILLLDGCTAHNSDYFLDQCGFYNVIPFFEPAGSSDQVQALDLGIFGIQKALKCKIKTKKDIGPAAKEVLQIVNSFIKTTTPDVVVSAFNQAGIYVLELPDGSFTARAEVEKARPVRNIDHTECKNLIRGNKTVPLLSFDK